MQTRQKSGAIMRLAWHVSRIGVPLSIGATCLWIVSHSIAPDAFEDLGFAITTLSLWQWIGALAATLISFWALARYDLVLHRHFQTQTPDREASITGAAAIAIGQTIGMGVISGAFVRWRMLPNLSISDATKISVAVAITFLAGLVFTTGIVGHLGPHEAFPPCLSNSSIVFFCICILGAFACPRLSAFGRQVNLPSVKALLTIGALTLIDIVFAGTALWMLLPNEVDLTLVALLPAFVLALGAGIVTGAPGGVGPFELILLLLLPQVPDQHLLVGVVAYRLIYYAVPTVMSVALLARPFSPNRPDVSRLVNVEQDCLTGHKRAEVGLLNQSGAQILRARGAEIGVISPGQSLCALFNPLRGSTQECLRVLQHVAHERNQIAFFYKARAKDACHARNLGWSVVHVANDMVIDVGKYSINGPRFRQLRRKLKQAQKAGVSTEITQRPSWAELERVDQKWQATHGPARGLTMGFFCPQYLRHQKIYLALQHDELVGFASFHHGRQEVCLDLMRIAPDAANGTMHALIFAAIEDARTQGRATLSLAALPPETGWLGWMARKSGTKGLRQFKASFGANPVPLYAAAPSTPELYLALLDLWIAIRRPHSSPVQVHNEDYEFDVINNA